MKKNRAVFTHLCNEPRFFPLWHRYYSRYFEAGDIHVIHILKPRRLPFDDQIVSLSHSLGFTIHEYQEKQICEFQVAVDNVQEVQRKLLEEYDVVVFAEVDEFICHEDGLDKYISRFNGDFVRTTGWEILHHHESEPAIDLDKPIMAQRSYWYADELYNKPLISRIPLRYIHGFHRCHEDPDRRPDYSLHLVHLRRVDYHLCVERALERQKNEDNSTFAKIKAEGGNGWQHYLDSFEMKNWFDLAREGEVKIPEFAKNFPI